MAHSATLRLDDKDFPLPVMTGSEGEKAIDTRKLRASAGYLCYDQGYGNTGACESAITFLDGDKGILRHRGYPIEQLAEHSDFVETAYLIIYGELPDALRRKEFGRLLRENAAIEMQMQRIFEGFPKDAPPMAMLSSQSSPPWRAHYPHPGHEQLRKRLGLLRLGRGHGDFQNPDHRCDDLPLPARPARRISEGPAVLRKLPCT